MDGSFGHRPDTDSTPGTCSPASRTTTLRGREIRTSARAIFAGFDADLALTSAICSGAVSSVIRPDPNVKWIIIATAWSATDTPIAMPIADMRRTGASDSGGMRAGGRTPANLRFPFRGDAGAVPAGGFGSGRSTRDCPGAGTATRRAGRMSSRSVRTADNFGCATRCDKGWTGKDGLGHCIPGMPSS